MYNAIVTTTRIDGSTFTQTVGTEFDTKADATAYAQRHIDAIGPVPFLLGQKASARKARITSERARIADRKAVR